nr:CPXCG motif-containing cysteine-rich protein [Thiocystis violacea]
MNAVCPWCDAPLEMEIDLTAGDRCYVEDCQICCSPILVNLTLSPTPDDDFRVTLTREGD